MTGSQRSILSNSSYRQKKPRLLVRLALGLAFGAAMASAGTITFTCDSSMDATVAGTCAYLNSVVAGYYNNTFTNANADIYIEMNAGAGLGASTPGFYNFVSYNAYLAALQLENGS